MDTISSNAGSAAAIANEVVKALGKQLPSSQERLGDDKLNQARDLVTSEVQSMVEEDELDDLSKDLNVIGERIT
jgi:hypothetical protein